MRARLGREAEKTGTGTGSSVWRPAAEDDSPLSQTIEVEFVDADGASTTVRVSTLAQRVVTREPQVHVGFVVHPHGASLPNGMLHSDGRKERVLAAHGLMTKAVGRGVRAVAGSVTM